MLPTSRVKAQISKMIYKVPHDLLLLSFWPLLFSLTELKSCWPPHCSSNMPGWSCFKAFAFAFSRWEMPFAQISTQVTPSVSVQMPAQKTVPQIITLIPFGSSYLLPHFFIFLPKNWSYLTYYIFSNL